MKAAVINVSWPHYNLGAAKASDWLRSQGHEVEILNADPGMFLQVDLLMLSVIFSWHAPIARNIALRMKATADVQCGGPGMFALANWWKQETGLNIHRGLDQRFERQRGDYRMTFASRGCPVGCSFCIVPSMEGLEFTMDPDFAPAPILCDNNLSALPVAFQEHIIRRYQEAGVRLLDANSGFEPRSFTAETRTRWEPILKGPWRFALDDMQELKDVERVMGILSDLPPGRKRVYVLIGNEPVDACYERMRKVLEWKGEPYCQPMMRLNALEKRPWVRHDWTEQTLKDFARYVNRFLWRDHPIWNYKPRNDESPPFRALREKYQRQMPALQRRRLEADAPMMMGSHAQEGTS